MLSPAIIPVVEAFPSPSPLVHPKYAFPCVVTFPGAQSPSTSVLISLSTLIGSTWITVLIVVSTTSPITPRFSCVLLNTRCSHAILSRNIRWVDSSISVPPIIIRTSSGCARSTVSGPLPAATSFTMASTSAGVTSHSL